MGQKVPPLPNRLGINKTWSSRWFLHKGFSKTLLQDVKIRQFLYKKLKNGGVAQITIERTADLVIITIDVAKPGVIIGKGGKDVEELKKQLEKLVGSTVRLNIKQVEQVYKEAALVAQEIVGNIERRVSYRRAVKQAIKKVMESGAKGVKIMCAGRLNGGEIARTEWLREGSIPLHTWRADIDYASEPAHTSYGVVGIKVWINRGEIL
ncbi:MAG: 30S ribosomal protein S3 [bacterium]